MHRNTKYHTKSLNYFRINHDKAIKTLTVCFAVVGSLGCVADNGKPYCFIMFYSNNSAVIFHHWSWINKHLKHSTILYDHMKLDTNRMQNKNHSSHKRLRKRWQNFQQFATNYYQKADEGRSAAFQVSTITSHRQLLVYVTRRKELAK